MTRPVTQVCPNCQRVHDTSVYVTGQRVLCSCGIHFEVTRKDVTRAPPTAASPAAAPSTLGEGHEPTLTPSSRDAAAGADGSTAVALPAPTIPGYELKELLGKGGMGEVWRARQLSLGRMVAVKVLPPRLAKDPEFVARFDKEATALASLSHPNITQIIDRGVSGEHYYFVMELVIGKSLREIISSGRPVPAEALKISMQICRAIDHAHQQQIIHRDLKPENILIDEGGHVKVVDFGLAGMRGSKRNVELTATAVAMGTVNYMAPEQRRDAKNVDQRADIYSLGVIMYELLTGELPIGRFKLPSERIRGLDTRLDEIVGKTLETDAEARPARALEVVRALEPLLSTASLEPLESQPGRPTLSGRPASQPPSFMQNRRTPLWVGLGVLGGMALLGGALKLWPKEGLGDDAAAVQKGPEWYEDTEDELFSQVKVAGNVTTLDFEPGGTEEVNTHSGMWKLEDGALSAVQYGPPTHDDHPKLVPRAYLAHRYYSTDDFVAEVDMQVDDLSEEFPALPRGAQRYGELAFRIKDTQVSVFAMPDDGMRLLWKYVTPDGVEISDHSGKDVGNMTADEVRVPPGRFHVRLALSKGKNGSTNVEARINGSTVSRKVLPGLAGQIGKVALGCKNLSCRFDDLKVSGKAIERPKSDTGSGSL